jgi:hypothetical protein
VVTQLLMHLVIGDGELGLIFHGLDIGLLQFFELLCLIIELCVDVRFFLFQKGELLLRGL